jgi:glycosyltransferase involved in cell wall biosynthesis
LVIARITRKYDIDILHARGWPTFVETAGGAFLSGRAKTVYGFHGKTFEDISGVTLRRRCAQRAIIKLYDRVVTLTPRMRDEVASDCGLSVESIRVVPNGVDVNRFAPQKHKSTLRSAFGIPLDRFVIGNVGRLDPVKNQKTILRSLRQLRRDGIAPYFILVGEGVERSELENQVKTLGLDQDVRFVGYSDQVQDLMNCMDVYVQPSYYEGFSNTILEAMACGVPVLTTDVGGTRDVIESGREGFFFEPEDHGRLASLIARLQNDRALLDEMGKDARSRTIKNFSVESTVALYENLYIELRSTC